MVQYNTTLLPGAPAAATGADVVAGAEAGGEETSAPGAEALVDEVVVTGPTVRVFGWRALGLGDAGDVHNDGLAEAELVAKLVFQLGLAGQTF